MKSAQLHCCLRKTLLAQFAVLIWGNYAKAGTVLGDLPETFEVQAIGTYGGFDPVDVRLDDSGIPTKEATVIVNKPGVPVVIVLTSYEPVVWNLGRTADTHIAGVLVSGINGQALIGIDQDTRFEISTNKKRGTFPWFYGLNPERGLLEMNERIDTLLGKPMTRFQNEATGNAFLIGEPAEPADVIFSDDFTVEDYEDSTLPPARLGGSAAIGTLIADGKIRPATQGDIEEWLDAASAPYQEIDPDLRYDTQNRDPMLRVEFSYVVLEEFPFSRDDYDAIARSFLVPEDLTLSEHFLWTNFVYVMDGTRSGLSAHRPPQPPRPDDSAWDSLFAGLPADFKLHAVGTYSADVNVPGVQLDDSGHEVTQAEVVVNDPSAPVILVLTAYDPVVWRVGIAEGTELAGVIVSGYHGQALIGIPAETPHQISTYVNPGGFEYLLAFEASEELLDMNERLNLAAEKSLDSATFGTVDGIFHVGDPLENGLNVRYSDDLTLESYLDPDRPLAGKRGLDQLVSDGKLRPATVADINAWIDKESEPFQSFAPGIRVRSRLRPDNTYVVLDDMVIPNGLFGAHRVTFLVPNDIPIPEGDPGHSDILRIDFDTAAVIAQIVVDFESWAEQLEKAVGGNPEVASKADSDSDGIDDDLEFVMGSDPLDPKSRGTLEASVAREAGTAFISLLFPMRNNSFGIEGILETSANGVDWSKVENGFEFVESHSINDWTDRIKLRSISPAGSGEEVSLFRLRAVPAPD